MLLTNSYRDLSIEKSQTNRSENNLSSLQIQEASGDTSTVNKTNIEIVSPKKSKIQTLQERILKMKQRHLKLKFREDKKKQLGLKDSLDVSNTDNNNRTKKRRKTKSRYNQKELLKDNLSTEES